MPSAGSKERLIAMSIERRGPRNGNGKVEGLKGSLFEVRFADLERDAAAVAALFNQLSAIEHLAGIAPAETPPGIDVKKFGIKTNTSIVRATGDEIAEYYKERPGLILLVAVDARSRVVGTVTLEKPGMGLTFAGVSRLVVSDSVRRKGVGKQLLRAANTIALSRQRDGGMECSAIGAGIIKVPGQEAPLALFGSEGYRQGAELKDNCWGWDNATRLFVKRNVIPVRRERQDREPKFDPADFPKAA